MPRYAIYVDRIGVERRPHYVTVRQLGPDNILLQQEGGEFEEANEYLAGISAVLQATIRTSVQRFFPIVNANANISGYLSGVDADNQELGEPIPLASLNEISTEMLQRIIDMVQSRDDLTIESVTWKFVINQMIYYQGASSNPKLPSYASKKTFTKTWKGHDVNCAAFAIIHAMHYSEHWSDERTVLEAKKLQESLKWGDYVSIDQIMQAIPVRFPHYRITVVIPTVLNYFNTATGSLFDPSTKKYIYLVFDGVQKHFGATLHPHQIFTKVTNNKDYRTCYDCNSLFTVRQGHDCEECTLPEVTKRKRKDELYHCKSCNTDVFFMHNCLERQCRNCPLKYKKNAPTRHRCIIYEEDLEKRFSTAGCGEPEGVDSAAQGDGSLPCCFAYDIEARIEIRSSTVSRISEFALDSDETKFKPFTNSREDLVCKEFYSDYQQANWIGIKNIYSGKTYEWTGPECLKNCILFLLEYNRGNNTMWAHNASSYDTRLIIEEFSKLAGRLDIESVERGTKFMILKINKSKTGALTFYDSLNHLKGSLASLAEDTCPDSIRKGDFPHLFNTAENWDADYTGSIPHISYFDLQFKKNYKEVSKFKTYYYEHMIGYAETQKRLTHRYVPPASFEPFKDITTNKFEWNFRKELLAYARNDVDILARLLKDYNDAAFEKLKMMPLFHPTAPGYIHHVVKTENSKLLEIGGIPEDDMENTLNDMAESKTWAVLKDSEYWFARRALRGGRTEIKSVYYKLSDEELARGDRISYIDVVSMYPAMQVLKDYPVGLPEIFIYNPFHKPCLKHKGLREDSDRHRCSCPPEKRNCFNLRIVENLEQPSTEELLTILKKPGFSSIICLDLVPPKDLWHPVICYHDPHAKKTLFSNQNLNNCYTTSAELIVAIEAGYKVSKVHRLDQYVSKPSLWREITMQMIVEKTINSKPTPTPEAAEKLLSEYAEIGDDFVDAIKASIDADLWGNRPAKKQTAKTMMNSMWGKNAQRPIMPKSVFFDEDDNKGITEHFNLCAKNMRNFLSAQKMGHRVKYKYEENGATMPTDFSGGYIPAAVFVTAYARLKLWEEMNKIDSDPNDRRVLMCDTDSIIYINRVGKYTTPTGGALGQWEIEKADYAHGGTQKITQE